MSAKSASRPAPTRAAALRPVSRHFGQTVGDVLLIVVGLLILVGIGYVGYRTQVRGEALEKVLPFLAVNKNPASDPAANPVGEPEGTTKPAAKPRPATKPDPAEADPDNTLFGRRTHPSSKPAAPTPAK